MPMCVNCHIQLRNRTQLHEYFAVDLSPDLVSVIEDWCGREVSGDDQVCQECVSLITSEVTNRLENPDHQSRKQVGHVCVCICCGISLSKRSNRRRHKLPDAGPEKSYIENIISPRQVPDEAFACHACWMRAHAKRAPRPPAIRPEQVFIPSSIESRVKNEQEHAVQGASDPNIAFASTESEEILVLNPPPSVEPWVEDNHGHAEQEASDPNIAPTPTEPEDISIPSNIEHRVENDQEHPEQEPEPRSNSASPISEADSWAELNLPLVQKRVQRDREDTIRLPNYRRTANTTQRCLVPNCENSERRRIPLSSRREILKKQKIYLTPNARVCQNHSAVDNWGDIEFIPTFNASQIENMINLLSDDRT